MADWKNKIVGHDEVSPDQLLANPNNWRIHPRTQQDALAGVIDEVGYIRSITVNRRTGHVIDGHLRVLLALRQGVKGIPVEYVDLSEQEEVEALATLDPIAAMAIADGEKLDALLREVQTSNEAVGIMLEQLATRYGVIPPNDPMTEWKGMPEFVQEEQEDFAHFMVHVASQEDLDDLSRRLEQNLTKETKYIWHPKRPFQPRPHLTDES